jgi:hypothetical protein
MTMELYLLRLSGQKTGVCYFIVRMKLRVLRDKIGDLKCLPEKISLVFTLTPSVVVDGQLLR